MLPNVPLPASTRDVSADSGAHASMRKGHQRAQCAAAEQVHQGSDTDFLAHDQISRRNRHLLRSTRARRVRSRRPGRRVGVQKSPVSTEQPDQGPVGSAAAHRGCEPGACERIRGSCGRSPAPTCRCVCTSAWPPRPASRPCLPLPDAAAVQKNDGTRQ